MGVFYKPVTIALLCLDACLRSAPRVHGATQTFLTDASLQKTRRIQAKVFADRTIHHVPDCVFTFRQFICWRLICLLPAVYITERNLSLESDSINFASGVRWMTNVSASSAAKSLS